jgi:serine/threonine protein kinase
MQEVVACRQFCHPNVVGFLGIGSDETDQLYSFVTPYMKNGNVMEFLKHYPNANRLTLVSTLPANPCISLIPF